MNKTYKFQDLKLRNLPFEDELCEAACRVIRSGRYINGEQVENLSAEIGSLCSAPHVVCVSNGLDALRLIFRAYIIMGVMSPGDEVIIPANTYIASFLAVSDAALVPVPVDINPSTFNLDTSLIENAITTRTKAIMPVHLYGTPCWDERLKSIASSHNLKIIEDNAQALGAQAAVPGLHGSCATGSLGDAAAVSFYPTKNLGALGDAGAVITHDEQLAEVVRRLANYGADKRYHNIYCGYNCRMDEMQAAMLLVSLRHLHCENQHRRRLAQIYADNIKCSEIIAPAIFPEMKQVWHQYVVRVLHDRSHLQKRLAECGISTDILYPVPAHKQPCYPQLAHYSLPVCESLAGQILCLPITSITSADDAAHIAAMLHF